MQGKGPRRPRTADYNPNAKYSMKKQIEYKETHIDPNEPIRLNRFLANAGVCSRREADDFIAAGVVSVNGKVVTELGTKVLRSDNVVFHNQPVMPEKKVYILLNKPVGIVCTADPREPMNVVDYLNYPIRIFPVGRLDKDSQGLLLLTSDGEIVNRILRAAGKHEKEYIVTVNKPITAEFLKKMMFRKINDRAVPCAG